MYTATGTNRPLSFRQKRAVDLWLKYGRKNKARALREAGYTPSVYRQPHKVFESPAVQDYLEKGGFGRDGLQDNCKPEAKPIPIIKPMVDFSAIPVDTLMQLKERLKEVGYESIPPQPERVSTSKPFTTQDW